jgi:hypothetical protein
MVLHGKYTLFPLNWPPYAKLPTVFTQVEDHIFTKKYEKYLKTYITLSKSHVFILFHQSHSLPPSHITICIFFYWFILF